MENLKFYKIAIALLLVLNIGTLTFMWMHRPLPPDQRGPFQFLVHATGMDEVQQKSYAQLRDAHRAQVESFRAQNSDLRKQLFAQLAQHSSSDPIVLQLTDSIASVKRQEEILTYEHFREVRAICRPDQQSKFDAAIGEAIQSMVPPPPRR